MAYQTNESSSALTLAEIQSARLRIQDQVIVTPLLYAPRLSELAQADVYLKCENLQRTGSFKVRGALNMVMTLVAGDIGDKPSGMITASSGNHGQAVAYAAERSGIPCTVVVPEDVIPVKEAAIRKYGAEVIRCGTTSTARIDLAMKLSAEQNLTFVPPYDHPLVAAGQGTVGLEIAEQLPSVARVYVPIGGGGLSAGISTAIQAVLPLVSVVGVEPDTANDTYLSRQSGEIIDIGQTDTVADGLRTSHPGAYTFPILQRHLDDIVLVSDDEIKKALFEVLESSKLLVEPSGCTSIAAALRHGANADGPVVCVLSGGNVELPSVFAWGQTN